VAMMIDNKQESGILGTIAGDDTVFAVLKNSSDIHKVEENLKEIFPDLSKE